MNTSEPAALKDCIKSYLNVEIDGLALLADWCRTVDVPAGLASMKAFKDQLRQALDNPGLVTPQLYEKWTHGDELENQEAVQQRLQEIWNACFE